MGAESGRWELSASSQWHSADYAVSITRMHGAQSAWILRCSGTYAAAIRQAGMPTRSGPGYGLRAMIAAASSVTGCSDKLIRLCRYDLRYDGKRLGWHVYKKTVDGTSLWHIDYQHGHYYGMRLRSYFPDTDFYKLCNRSFRTRRDALDALEVPILDFEAHQTSPMAWYRHEDERQLVMPSSSE